MSCIDENVQACFPYIDHNIHHTSFLSVSHIYIYIKQRRLIPIMAHLQSIGYGNSNHIGTQLC